MIKIVIEINANIKLDTYIRRYIGNLLWNSITGRFNLRRGDGNLLSIKVLEENSNKYDCLDSKYLDYRLFDGEASNNG